MHAEHMALRLVTGISHPWQLHLACETRSLCVSHLKMRSGSFGDTGDPCSWVQCLAVGPAGQYVWEIDTAHTGVLLHPPCAWKRHCGVDLTASFCLLNLCRIPVWFRVQEPSQEPSQEPRYHCLREWLLQGSLDAKPVTSGLGTFFPLSLLYKGIS